MPPTQALSIPDDFTGSALACRRGEALIFRRLDFVLPPGGALVLIGPNGSGKSSLLRLMAGLTPRETGVLAWGGTDIREDLGAHHGRLHFIGHSDALKPVQHRLFYAMHRMRLGPEGLSKKCAKVVGDVMG